MILLQLGAQSFQWSTCAQASRGIELQWNYQSTLLHIPWLSRCIVSLCNGSKYKVNEFSSLGRSFKRSFKRIIGKELIKLRFYSNCLKNWRSRCFKHLGCVLNICVTNLRDEEIEWCSSVCISPVSRFYTPIYFWKVVNLFVVIELYRDATMCFHCVFPYWFSWQFVWPLGSALFSKIIVSPSGAFGKGQSGAWSLT